MVPLQYIGSDGCACSVTDHVLHYKMEYIVALSGRSDQGTLGLSGMSLLLTLLSLQSTYYFRSLRNSDLHSLFAPRAASTAPATYTPRSRTAGLQCSG
jgi:hypothetical protein